MAQHDYSIANQGFPATRADINNVLSAIATNNSGTSAPSTQYAGQFWIDTTSTTWTLYIHDGADDIQFATIDTSANTVNFIDSELGDNSVTTAKIADGNVTSAKLSYPLTTFSSTGIDDNATSTAITIDSSENVGIGTASPSTRLQVSTAGSTGTQVAARFSSSTDVVGVKIERSGSSWRIASQANLFLGADYDSNSVSGDSNVIFETEATERMRINSSGDFMVGTTSNLAGIGGSSTQGVALSSGSYGGLVAVSRSGNPPIIINRQTSDGTIQEFRKDGTTIGNIGTLNDDLFICSSTSGHAGLSFANINRVLPTNNSGTPTDNTTDLGASTDRFADLYLGGGLYVGGTAAANYLDDYEEGTWTPAFTASGGGTATVNILGNYVKVGKIVHIQMRIMTTAFTLSGDVTVSGLPFTSDSTTNHNTAVSVQGFRFATDMPNLSAYILNNTTEITLDKGATNATSRSYLTNSDMTGGTNKNTLILGGSYEIS